MRSPQRICAGSILFCLLVNCLTAKGITIGPGSGNLLSYPPLPPGLPAVSLDVHRTPTPLAAGTYSVTSFSFHNVTQGATPGGIVPFLATLTNPGVQDTGPLRAYQTIWVGPSTSVGSVSNIEDPANIITVSYAGAQQFSLAAGSNIYAGFYTTGTGRVGHRQTEVSDFPARTDHDTSFGALTAGQTATNFSNPFYNAIFGFHIGVEPSGGPPAVPGDFDGDSDVDGADFVIWQTNFPAQSGKTLASGDADADGDVDGADFVAWQTHFPTSPGGGSSPVPEPPAGILAMIGAAAVLLRVRRHRAT